MFIGLNLGLFKSKIEVDLIDLFDVCLDLFSLYLELFVYVLGLIRL